MLGKGGMMVGRECDDDTVHDLLMRGRFGAEIRFLDVILGLADGA